MNDQRRTGMTLLELLLVLALIVAVASLTLPALRQSMENQRLRKSADTIRAEWSRARNTAMRTGRIQVFRFQIGGPQYMVEPWYTGDDYLEAAGPSASPDGLPLGQAGATATTSAGAAPINKQLPDGILFVGADTSSDNRALNIEQSLSSSPQLDMIWSPPILFYPNGETSTAQVTMSNARQQYIQVQLRGLTGIAQATDLMSPQEIALQGIVP
jgi:type II secretory pathway pseudopilin PulG